MGQHVLAGTPVETAGFCCLGAKFYWLHALAGGNWCIKIKEKTTILFKGVTWTVSGPSKLCTLLLLLSLLNQSTIWH